MSKLSALKSASTLGDVADLLDIAPSTLSYVLYKLTTAQKYTQFGIPKKGGGTRHIHAPTGKLKVAQRRLANLLYECHAEIMAITPRRSLSHGFRKSHSIVTNAQRHKHRRYVLKLDLATSSQPSTLAEFVDFS